MHRIIDWNELWKAIYISSPERLTKGSDPAALWNKRASAYQKITKDEINATEQELAILDLKNGDTVLDVGAGTGRLAVPIAHVAAHVTALDPSGGMLALLRERMEAEGRNNYSCVQMRWEDVHIGKDVEPHDLVIAAFSLGLYDLAEALQKLELAACRSVCIFWHVGEWRCHGGMDLYRTMFGVEAATQKGYPDYIFPINILHDAEIYTNVQIIHENWQTTYESIDEAVKTWVAMHKPDQRDLSPIIEYYSRVLRQDETGKFVETITKPIVAISWTKSD
jgi:SAM-dependent methyltransferase